MNLKDDFGITEITITESKDELYSYPLTNIVFKGIPVALFVGLNDTGERKIDHIYDDFNGILAEGFEKIIKEKFIFWLNGNTFTDDDQTLYDGLKLYSIVYSYNRIIDKYSPTGVEGFFSKFEFEFEAGNDYAANVLQASSIEIFVQDGKVVGTHCFDV